MIQELSMEVSAHAYIFHILLSNFTTYIGY